MVSGGEWKPILVYSSGPTLELELELGSDLDLDLEWDLEWDIELENKTMTSWSS